MNWKGMHAWAKCKVTFSTDGKFTAAMATYAPGAKTDSCSVTQSVLGMVVSPGTPPQVAALKRNDLGAINTEGASKKVSELLDGDNVIYLSISPNHYFTVIPLSSNEVALLQGFQGSYTLTEWMQAKENGVMQKATFMMHFYLLFSKTTSVAIEAAQGLFALPGREADIADWFKDGNVRLTQLAYAGL